MKLLNGGVGKDGKGTGQTNSACKPVKHPGHSNSRPKYSLFCRLNPGKYTLKFFAYYTLGGLHPCQYFQAQFALKPLALVPTSTESQCDNTETNGGGEGLLVKHISMLR